jgi:hypothetical protein
MSTAVSHKPQEPDHGIALRKQVNRRRKIKPNICLIGVYGTKYYISY